MRKVQVTLIVTIISFFSVTGYAAKFFDIDKPSVKKTNIYVSMARNSKPNRLFTQSLKKILDQSLLFKLSNNKKSADFFLTMENSVEAGSIVVSLEAGPDAKFAPKVFGVRFKDKDPYYLGLKAAQLGNRILKELFGIKGSFGSALIWSSIENNRKVLYRATFGINDSREQISYNLFTNYGAHWSPDKKNIVYTSHTVGGTAITLQQVNPLRLKTVSIFPEIGKASSPYWAPDGTIFLTIHRTEQNSDVIQYRLKGEPYSESNSLTEIRKWTYDKTIETEAKISPDGKSMAYVSDQTAAPQIYLMKLNTGKSKRLTRNGDYNVTPVWSPNGKMIAYRAIRNRTSSIFRINVKSGIENRITPLNINAESPTWSPDGSLVAFSGTPVGNDKTIQKIYYISSSGGEYRRVEATSNQENQTNPSWGPALQ